MVDSTLTPGAQSSTSGPRLLKPAIKLLLSIAETAITFLYLPGYPTLEVVPGGGGPALPAAATNKSPLLKAVLHIVSNAVGADPPPKLMLRMCILLLMHQSIPAISQLHCPLPELLSTLTA